MKLVVVEQKDGKELIGQRDMNLTEIRDELRGLGSLEAFVVKEGAAIPVVPVSRIFQIGDRHLVVNRSEAYHTSTNTPPSHEDVVLTFGARRQRRNHPLQFFGQQLVNPSVVFWLLG